MLLPGHREAMQNRCTAGFSWLINRKIKKWILVVCQEKHFIAGNLNT